MLVALPMSFIFNKKYKNISIFET